MTRLLTAVAFFLILGLALLADRLMDMLGPTRYLLVNAVGLLVAWLLIRAGNRHEPEDESEE